MCGISPARAWAQTQSVLMPIAAELAATLSLDVSAPRLARSAAVTFMRDYARWSNRQVAITPVREKTRRVLGLLEHGGRAATVDVAAAVASVRIARAPRGTFVVTSAIGNFLVGGQRSRCG
jgi:acyl-coenzyme A thioesterase PaaI-like protein